MRLVNFFQGYLVEYFAIIASRLWTAGGTRESLLSLMRRSKERKIPKLMEKILESTNSDGLGKTAWNEWGGVSSDFRLSAAHCLVFAAHRSKIEKWISDLEFDFLNVPIVYSTHDNRSKIKINTYQLLNQSRAFVINDSAKITDVSKRFTSL